MEESILMNTSKLILIPTVIALLLARWGDVLILSLQAICAMWYHSSHTNISFYADQLSIYLLITHTFLLAITNNITPFLFILAFGYMFVVYIYGKINTCFCFNPNKNIGDMWHGSMHVLGVIVYSCSMLFILSYEANGIFAYYK